MKRTFIQFAFLCFFTSGFCQNSQKYLVFTFNSTYQVGDYTHGTGDNVWIVPYDSCRNGLCEIWMRPLSVTDYLLESLADSVTCNQNFGYFPTDEYSSNANARKLFKNRKRIQLRITKYTYQKAKEELSIYMVPIVAKCSSHRFGYFRRNVITIDGELEIWNDFWDKDKSELRPILNWNFSL